MNSYSTPHTFSEAGEWLLGTARRNPEALLLLAAGCALLMRTGGGVAGSKMDGEGWSHENGYSTASANPRSREGLAGSVSGGARYVKDIKDRATDTASGYVSDIQERVSETAADYANNITGRISDAASSAADAASTATGSIVEGSKSLKRQAQTTLQSTMEGVLRDQPLAVAAVGFIAGAAVAAAFPATDAEVRTLGGARETLSEAVDQAGKKVMGAAAKAGERLKASAEEKGLTSDGLKNLASDVTNAFTEAVASGERSNAAAEGTGRPTTSEAAPRPNTNRDGLNPVVSDDSGIGSTSGRTPR